MNILIGYLAVGMFLLMIAIGMAAEECGTESFDEILDAGDAAALVAFWLPLWGATVFFDIETDGDICS